MLHAVEFLSVQVRLVSCSDACSGEFVTAIKLPSMMRAAACWCLQLDLLSSCRQCSFGTHAQTFHLYPAPFLANSA